MKDLKQTGPTQGQRTMGCQTQGQHPVVLSLALSQRKTESGRPQKHPSQKAAEDAEVLGGAGWRAYTGPGEGFKVETPPDADLGCARAPLDRALVWRHMGAWLSTGPILAVGNAPLYL